MSVNEAYHALVCFVHVPAHMIDVDDPPSHPIAVQQHHLCDGPESHPVDLLPSPRVSKQEVASHPLDELDEWLDAVHFLEDGKAVEEAEAQPEPRHGMVKRFKALFRRGTKAKTPTPNATKTIMGPPVMYFD